MVLYVEESNLNATLLRACTIAALSFAVLLTIFDFCSLRSHWKRGESSISDKVSIVITVIYLVVLSLYVLLRFSCWHPVLIWTLFGNFYILSRGINTLFFVHRAKCVQGPNPILSEKWFTKYIPRCLYIYYGSCAIANTYGVPDNPDKIICVSDQFSYRARPTTAEATYLFLWFVFILELAITAVITFLFVGPLWRLYRAGYNDDGNTSIQQQRSRRMLKDALKYGVMLTAVNLLSSNCMIIFYNLYGDNGAAFAYWAVLDPVLNMGTTMIFFKRNRVSLWKVCCCIRDGMVQLCCCIRHGMVQLCCFAFIFEIPVPDSQQPPQKTLNERIANSIDVHVDEKKSTLNRKMYVGNESTPVDFLDPVCCS